MNTNTAAKTSWPRYVAIEGPIGVGKTSLAQRLALHFDAELVAEDAYENPFLERFYRDPRAGALPTQLFFLFQRARKVQDMRQSDLFEPMRVADFLLDKDRIFARMTLDEDELALYEQVYDRLAIDSPVPDLVIYLQAPAETLLERIATRGIAYEKMITRDYLERLIEAYARHFHYYDTTPLLMVNTTGIDLVKGQRVFEELLARVAVIRSGRHFFNPVRGTFPDLAGN